MWWDWHVYLVTLGCCGVAHVRYFTLLSTGELKYYKTVAPPPKGVIMADKIASITRPHETTPRPTPYSFKCMFISHDSFIVGDVVW